MTQQLASSPLAYAVPASDPPPSPRRRSLGDLPDLVRDAGRLVGRLVTLTEVLAQCSAGGGDDASPSASR